MRKTYARQGALLAAAFSSLLAGRIDAQEARVEGAKRAPAVTVAGEASYTFRPAVSIDGEPGAEMGVSAVQAAAAVRVQLGPRTFLTPGISYQGQLFRYEGMMSPAGNAELHALELPIMLTHALSAKWSLVGRLSPGLSGDFETLDRHFSAGAAAMAVRVISPRLVLGFGAAVSYGAGRWLPLPVVSANWQVSDKLRVDALLPESARATYRLGDRWEVGGLVKFEGARWALDGDAGEARTIDYFSIDTGAVLAMRVTGNTWINVFSGWNALRQYDIHGGPQDGDHDPDPSLVVRGGLEVRLPSR